MCLAPLPNLNITGVAYKKGIVSFDCGACPECLSRRSSRWALRGAMELKDCGVATQICLTYDQYLRNGRGKIIGEAVADRTVDVRDVQLFIKRLRKWYYKETGKTFKYLISAEYGKKTHRPHYHAILFGLQFPDVVPYKRSKRGNQIYTSRILTSIWKNGICTVDNPNVGVASIRYCTKYSAKMRSDDTFMLCSRGIGMNAMIREFNGKSYIVDGVEYPVPRQVWCSILERDYAGTLPKFTSKYRGAVEYGIDAWRENARERANFYALRDNDPQYIAYLAYWREKSAQIESQTPSVDVRISKLSDGRYASYKRALVQCLSLRSKGVPYPAPASGCKSAYERWCKQHGVFALPSPCQGRANDTAAPSKLFEERRAIVEHRKKVQYLEDCKIFDTAPKQLELVF